MRPPAVMKDCFGDLLEPGDAVVVVAPSAPMGRRFLHMKAVVVGRRGHRIDIRFPDSDYVKYNKWVLSDSIQKYSTWVKRDRTGVGNAGNNP